MKPQRVMKPGLNRHERALQGVSQACLFMLTALLATQASADQVRRPHIGEINIPSQGTGPSTGIPAGAGPAINFPGGGPIQGIPGQGAGALTPNPSTPPMSLPATVPAPSPVAIPAPVSPPVPAATPVAIPVVMPATLPQPPAPTAGAGGPAPVSITAPPTPVTRVTAPGQPQQGAGPGVLASSNPKPPPMQSPPNGAGPVDSVVMPDTKQPPQGGSRMEFLAPQASAASSRSNPAIQEIIPDAQALSSSMRAMQQAHGGAQDPSQMHPQAQAPEGGKACVAVTFRPDPQRMDTTLVDLTGDGLIVSAVPNRHIQNVFTRAGYSEVSLTQAARWCIAQAATRELVQLQSGFAAEQATRLVQVGSNWQLMSQDQWLTHQASLRPAVHSSTGQRLAGVHASMQRKATARANVRVRPAQSGAVTARGQRPTAPSSAQMMAAVKK